MKSFLIGLKDLSKGKPNPTGEQQLKALKKWAKSQQKFNKAEEEKGLASNYLWSELTLEDKVERLREELLKT